MSPLSRNVMGGEYNKHDESNSSTTILQLQCRNDNIDN